MDRRIPQAGLLALVLALTPAGAATAEITVANNNDSGTGSLRQAISDAVPGETIIVPADTYTLTSNELAIAKSLTISGDGAADTIIRALVTTRPFHVTGAANTVTISGVTIRDGVVAGSPAMGGGVLNEGASLTLRDVIVRDNHVEANGSAGNPGGIAHGGGVYNTGTLNVVSSQFVANTADALGGSGSLGGSAEGAGLHSGGTLTVDSSTFDGNVADARGGQGGPNPGQGGGLASGAGVNAAAVGPILVSSSTFTANTADASGGPGATGGNAQGGGAFLLSNSPTISAENLTFTGNTVRAQGGGGYASGGGLNGGANGPGTVNLTNITLSNNTADAAGAGGLAEGGNGYLGGPNTKVKNTLVSAGVGPPGGENCAGNPTSLGHNLDSLDQCGFHGSGDQVNKDPLLHPLEDNGGPVQTQALPPGSPAVNAGDNSGCPARDARGVTRPQDVACEIGAFELEFSATGALPTGAFPTSPVLTLTEVGAFPSTFRRGSLLPRLSRRVRTGTTLRFRLPAAARVAFAFRRARRGRRVGRRCVRPNSRNRGRRRCTRYVGAGRLAVNARAGRNRLRFQGRLSRRRALRPGRYRATLVASDAAGNRSAPKTVRFRMLPAAKRRRR